MLRNIGEGGFTFFTNYESKKGQVLKKNNKASMLFFWKEFQRQVRVEGEVSFLPVAESEHYFASRPRESQIAALASNQTQVIESRNALEARFDALTVQYQNKPIPKPEHWGGYVLMPSRFEFWQGRESRLHDRIQYTNINQNWKIQRLAP